MVLWWHWLEQGASGADESSTEQQLAVDRRRARSQGGGLWVRRWLRLAARVRVYWVWEKVEDDDHGHLVITEIL